MNGSSFLYDVAFSLLAQDVRAAKAVCRLLPGTINTFLFSSRQDEIVGSDGVEKFSDVFARDSRCVVVMHRAEWGQTPWTAVEATAIRSRFFERGPDFLTLVKLDSSPAPPWLPRTRIWGDHARLGSKGLAAVIAERIVAAGKVVREESAQEYAIRVDREVAAQATREAFLNSSQGVEAASILVKATRDEIATVAAEVGARVDQFPHGIVIAKGMLYSVGVVWWQRFSNTTKDCKLSVSAWRGYPDEFSRSGRGGDQLSTHDFYFDRSDDGGSTWRSSTKQYYSSKGLAHFVVKLLHDQIRPTDD